jgi:regulator of protease activity HflC (stomatin/prohibitin superfamily)
MFVPYLLIGIVLAALAVRTLFHRIVVFEFERGVRYDRGRAAGTLEPGVHWLLPTTTVTKVDIRPAFLAVPGQEVLTADGVGLKLTVVAKCQVVDPERALNSVAAYRDALYTQVQLTLREIVGATPVDSILASRLDLGKQLLSLAAPKVAEFGVNLLKLEVKDVTQEPRERGDAGRPTPVPHAAARPPDVGADTGEYGGPGSGRRSADHSATSRRASARTRDPTLR